jgi:hypothetical protein
MATYGLTDSGFVIKPLDVILQELTDDYTEATGMVPTGAAAQWVESLAVEFSEMWELALAVHTAASRDGASGAALEAVSGITGSTREGEDGSTSDLTLTGVPTTIVTAGNRARAASTGALFATLDDATIASVPAWAAATAYAVGDIVTNGGKIYVCITAGTSAGSGGPLTTAADITDNTAHWRHVGTGTGAVEVASEAVETGPQVAVSGDISEIVTPVSGWQGVVNLDDADVGQYTETDEDFRVRGEDELARGGDGTVDSLRTDLLDVADVISVTVFHNPTDTTDADGLPPHSVEALVRGGEDQDIFDALLAHVAAGIQTFGNTDGTSEDDEGFDQPISFSRPDEIEIYVDVELTCDADLYPDDGDDLVKEALVEFGDGLKCGRDAVSSALIARVFDVPGVLDVTVCDIGIASNPSASTTIAIALRELATYNTARITVVSTPATP